MSKNYRRLRAEDRGVIYRMNRELKSQQEIAKTIGFSQSAVSKELSRNRGQKGYRAKQAQEKASQRQGSKNTRPQLIVGKLKQKIDTLLRKKHSPEQVSGQLKKKGILVSHECIYSYIVQDKKEGGSLHKELRINGKRRYRRRCKGTRVGKISNRVGIEHRPESVNNRYHYGDWEVDLIEGSKGSGYLLSLYERKSRLGKLFYLKTKGAQETGNAIVKALNCYKVRTLTYDNGLEFAEHLRVSKALGAKGYFCQPYHSWEKGGVENFNGLVRQYYPKGSSFGSICSCTLARVQEQINQRPRKTLEYTSPSQLEPKLAA